MNKKKGWSIGPLVILNLLAVLLMFSWLLEPTRTLWLEADERFFWFFNNSLKNGKPVWRIFWALANHRLFDLVSALILLLVFITAGIRRGRQRWAWHLAVISVTVLAAFLGTRIGHLIPIQRASGTLIFPDAFYLSQSVTGFTTKDMSDNTFPGDHGMVAFIGTGFALYYLNSGYRWAAVIAGMIIAFPRLVSGAHWLSDELVGAVFVGLIVLAWFLATPLAGVLVSKFESIWYRILRNWLHLDLS